MVLLEVLEVGAVVRDEREIRCQAARGDPHVVDRPGSAPPLGGRREHAPLPTRSLIDRQDRQGIEPAVEFGPPGRALRPDLGPLQQLPHRDEGQRNGRTNERPRDGAVELTLLKA